MKNLKYSDLIFIAAEVTHLAKLGRYKEATAQFNELNPLQAIYAFSYVQKNMQRVLEIELALMMSEVELEMEAIAS